MLINFFASWCAPCLLEHPLLLRLKEREGATIIGIAWKNKPDEARAWLKKLGDPFRYAGVDPEGKLSLDWGLSGVPETYLVDGDGIVRLLTFLRDDPKCLCKQLVDICGVDYPEREARFEIVYNLLSLTLDQRVRVKIAVREDELAAESAGINTVVLKLQAFAVGAAIAGFAGVFNAAKLTIVSPLQFGFVVSVSALSAVVLGGMGNVVGVAVGAFVIYLIQSIFLKQLNILFDQIPVPIIGDIDFIQFQYVLYGIVLVLMMLKRPQGIYPLRRRARSFSTPAGRLDREGGTK